MTRQHDNQVSALIFIDYNRMRSLGRRSSAPMPHRGHISLAAHPRRGSEPAFRTHSPSSSSSSAVYHHRGSAAAAAEYRKSTDYLRHEFDRSPRKG
mgnify:CR=1 FL=1